MSNARPRLNYTEAKRRQVNSSDNAFLDKTIKQVIVCAVVAALIFTAAKINAPIFKSFTAATRQTIVYTFDYKKVAADIWDNLRGLPDIFSKSGNKDADIVNEDNASIDEQSSDSAEGLEDNTNNGAQSPDNAEGLGDETNAQND